MSSSGGSSVPRIQVFRPTMEEFKNFSEYIQKIESQGAHKAGLAKIIPPDGWTPRKNGYHDIDLVIPAPISQVVTGSQGLYQQINIQQKAMTVKEFEVLASNKKYQTPPHFDYEDLERKYWKNITYNSPIYGADVSGSLYDTDVDEFNIQHLNTILDMVKEDYEIQIEGVNTAYLYFGMWKTTFAWHTEDMDLYSINYLHFGSPKSWYVVPPEHGRRLERLAAGFFHGSHQSCAAFLRHKMTIISPSVLKQYSIPFQKITQEPGEFMITFPFGYHSGFNHGFNCAESTNFALPRWVEYGKRSIPCTCRNDCVKICMDMFVRKFQPEKYELWKAGKDFGTHPEDPSRHYAAPAPKKLELALSAQREERKRAKEAYSMQKIKRHPISKMGKCQSKNACQDTKAQSLEGDEDTEPYDINDAITNKKPRKLKKKRKESNSLSEEERKIKSNVVINEKIIEEIKSDAEIKVEDKVDEPDRQAEDESIKMEVDEAESDIETQQEMKLSKELLTNTCTNPLENEPETVASPDREVKVTPNVLDSPPELKPFWHPDLKAKDNIINTNENSNLSFQEHMKLLNKYPHLKQAISSGTFSVVPVNPKPQQKCISVSYQDTQNVLYENESSKSQIIKSKDALSPSSYSSSTHLSYTWRCEQTNNGLKLKIVQPRNVQPNIEETASDNLTDIDESPISSAQEETPVSSDDIKKDKKYSPKQKKKETNQTKETPSGCTIREKRCIKKAGSDQNVSDSSPNGSSPKVQRANCSEESWAHPIKDLWQHQPKNFEAEVQFNERSAGIQPHCAICVVFTPMYNKSSFPSEPSNVPSYSPVRMPAYCYGNSLNNECILDTNSLLRADGTAPLLICSICKVCVHATCYGISMLPMGSWTCTRCAKKALEAECCLCVLRGGALKPTNDNRWAHILCAILIDESFFENTLQKQPINVSNIPPSRLRLKCKYCIKTTLRKPFKGTCVQCQSGKCYLSYHVTCGYMAGVIFETNDWPKPIHMICTRHAAARRKPPKRQLTTVSVGEYVVAKHKNKRYYWAIVKKKYIQEYYSILFEDNSHSTNTLPEDIVSRNVALHGSPQINEKVQVKWTDDKIYNGIFKGSQSCELYVIEFDDGSVLHQERKQIYAGNEELPKEVQAKLSHSSDRRNLDFTTETEGKRVRISNHKYS